MPATTVYRFCDECGATLEDGLCPRCGTSPLAIAETVTDSLAAAAPKPDLPPAVPAEGARRRRVRLQRPRPARFIHVSRLMAVVLLTTVAVAGTVVAIEARGEAHDAHRRYDVLQSRLSTLQKRVTSQADAASETSAAVSGLSRRVSATEEAVQKHPDSATVIAKVRPSVFTVKTESGSGSAFVLTSSTTTSRLVTNAHVVDDVYRSGGRGVRLVTGQRTLVGKIIEVSYRYDLALIEVAAELPVLAVTPARASAGDAVFVVGSPLGYEGTVSTGIASNYRVEDGIEYLQFSAAVNPGNSGGPVVDAEGQVLGVASMKIVGFGIEGLSFAVPADRVCSTFNLC
ncbi:MAG: putative serine protease [Frankiales bacterium]|nr:putative serine protease [Frankiales bacterium]